MKTIILSATHPVEGLAGDPNYLADSLRIIPVAGGCVFGAFQGEEVARLWYGADKLPEWAVQALELAGELNRMQCGSCSGEVIVMEEQMKTQSVAPCLNCLDGGVDLAHARAHSN